MSEMAWFRQLAGRVLCAPLVASNEAFIRKNDGFARNCWGFFQDLYSGNSRVASLGELLRFFWSTLGKVFGSA
jgi:hypothetical protein